MSLVDELRSALDAPASIWLQFTRIYRGDKTDVYVFMEGGEDSSFYLPVIRRHCPSGDTIHPFNCRGKSGVFAAHRDITNKSPGARRALFFVDADLDPFLPPSRAQDPSVYVTDLYSVENWLVCERVLERIWTDVFGLQLADARWPLILRAFRDGIATFHKKMLVIMAWVLVHRRLGSKLNLKNIDPPKFFDASSEPLVPVRGRYARIMGATGLSATTDAWRSILAAARELKRISDPQRFCRGHYEMWYFIRFLAQVYEALSDNARPAARPGCKVDFTTSRAVMTLAPHVDTPASLSAFLSRQLV